MITLTEPTINFLPSFNRINFEIESDNATALGFKFAIKVYNADSGALVTIAYYDTAPDPFAPITFDVSRFLIEGYQYQQTFPATGEWHFNECILNRFYLKCYEYYDVAGNGIYEIDPATEVISDTYTCFAGSFNFFDRSVWDDSDFDGSNNEFYPLTDQVNFQMTSQFFKVFTFYDPNDYITSMSIIRIDTTGNTTFTAIKPLNASSDDLTHFTFRPSDYGVNTNTTGFTLTLNYTNPIGVCTTQFANITMMKCTKYDVKQLLWVNRFGAIDSYSFNLVSRKETSVERKQYQKDYDGYGEFEQQGLNIFQNTSPTFYTKETQKITLNTNYISDHESIVFRQLYSSPLIYLFASGDYAYLQSANDPHRSFNDISHYAFIPVKLNAQSYQIKTKQNDKLFQIEAQFDYSEPSFRQIV